MIKNNKQAGSNSQLIDIIMDIPFFAMLDGSELGVVAKHMNYYEIDEGETLFKEGDPGDSICFVITGALEVYKETAVAGKQVRIATVTRHKAIGEMSVIDEYTRSATVTASRPTCIVSLTKKGFDALLKENPKVGAAILKKVATLVCMNLRRTSSQLADSMLSAP